jgi:hypothetical protein
MSEEDPRADSDWDQLADSAKDFVRRFNPNAGKPAEPTLAERLRPAIFQGFPLPPLHHMGAHTTHSDHEIRVNRVVEALEPLIAQERRASVEAELSEIIDLFLANEPQDASAIPVHVLTVLQARLAALEEYRQ